MKTTLYTRDDVATVIRKVGLDRLMDHAISGIDGACHDFESHNFEVPTRSGFEYSHPRVGLLEWMPVMRCGDQILIKHVGYHPSNPERLGAPTILSTSLIFDTTSGHLAGMMDATFLTAIRTGAASAIASRILARPTSTVLGLIGAGAQAIGQLHGLSRVFDLSTVLVHDVDVATAESFRRRAAALKLGDVRITTAPLDEITSRSDVICTATSVEVGEGPVVPDKGFRSNTHINAVGSDFPGKTELPHTLLRRSLVCPDFRAQAVREGECQLLISDEIGPDLVTLVRDARRYQSYRDTLTVFDSTGWALEDYVVATQFMRIAEDLGCGTQVELESLSRDPKDPYGFAFDDPVDIRLAAGGGHKAG